MSAEDRKMKNVLRLIKNNIWKRKLESEKRKLEIETMEGMSSGECLQYDFDTIKGFTNNFSDDNKVTESRDGPVYKGTLPNGKIFAVKFISSQEQFKNQVLFLAKLQHQNLDRLLGFCLQGEEKLLIYEFVDKSLEHFLSDEIARADFEWDKRYKIIGEIARGVQYLHENSQLRVIHCDLNPTNILLDEELNVKITNFGQATGLRECNLLTNQDVRGSIGYIAPEAMEGDISPKTDVYSFGVLLLEIVCGTKARLAFAESLPTYAWRRWLKGMVSNLIDNNSLQRSPTPEIMRCIHFGLLCVQENTSDRPTMSSVVNMLSSISIALAEPSRPAFCLCDEPDSSIEEMKMWDRQVLDRVDGLPIWRGKSTWPELLGKNGKEAAKTIECENRYVTAIVLLEGTPVTHDLKCNRVRVIVNRKGKVVDVPHRSSVVNRDEDWFG